MHLTLYTTQKMHLTLSDLGKPGGGGAVRPFAHILFYFQLEVKNLKVLNIFDKNSQVKSENVGRATKFHNIRPQQLHRLICTI